MGKRWNGKRFDGVQMKGINRFVPFSETSDASFNQQTQILSSEGIVSVDDETAKITTTVVEQHPFDISINPSSVQQNKQSVVIRYGQYQSIVSLWKTMVDEIRILPLSVILDETTLPSAATDIEVMIGLGCMKWSGGMLNASPFCLYRRR